MKRLTRVLAVTFAATFAVPALTLPATAQPQSGSEQASSEAYFTATAVPNPSSAPAAPPNLIRDSQAETVEKGNLAVAASGGRETRVSFFYFSLTSIPFGSTITKATMTVPLVPDSATNRRISPKPTNVRACAPDDSGFSTEDGAPLNPPPPGTPEQLQYRGAPERKCDVFASEPATQDGEAYVLDITGLAATWGEVNDGVALTRAEESDPNFQVVFSRGATLTFEYTAPAEEAVAPVVDVPTTDVGSTDTDFGAAPFTGSSGSTDFGGTDFGQTSAAPLAAEALPADAALPQTAEEPAVAARPQSAGGPFEMLTPTASFWLSVLLLAGLLGLLSLILGDSRSPALAASRPTRLSRALSAPPGQRPSLLGRRAPLLGQ